MLKNKKNNRLRAFTLMEVIVASILLAVTLSSLANIFVVGRRYILHSRSRMAGGELGRIFIEPLQQDVRQDTWDTANNGLAVTVAGTPRLCVGVPLQPNCPAQPAQRTLDGIVYNADYTIADNVPDLAAVPPGTTNMNLRRAQVIIRWAER